MLSQTAADSRHAHDDDLQLYILGQLTEPEFAGLEGHLSACPECTDALGEAARLVHRLGPLVRRRPLADGVERRSEPRFVSGGVVRVRALSPRIAEPVEAHVVDISKNGLALMVPDRFACEAIVQVRFGTTFAVGEVRWCSEGAPEGFRIGIHLQDMVAARAAWA